LRQIACLLLLTLMACDSGPETVVDVKDHDTFWLWAGVKPQPVLKDAKTVYLHYGEVKAVPEGQLQVMRPNAPRTSKQEIWLVVRAESLQWSPATYNTLFKALDDWSAAGNNLAGLQVDFDSKTRHLDRYAIFLAGLRRQLHAKYRLSITGLLDWSANGDPKGLAALGHVVDEIVVQVYQGRQTIPGYAHYLERLDRLDLPFRIGLVQGGDWKAPKSLNNNPDFRGYVVFLVNPKQAD
jgi:Protein of unknown function (DUF3142)